MAVRALPGARRSLRSLCSIISSSMSIHRGSAGLPVDAPAASRLRVRSRWEHGSSVNVATRRAHGLAASPRRWLMRARWQDARFRQPAGGLVGAVDVAGYQHELRARSGRIVP